MLKKILKTEGVQILSKKEQKQLSGGLNLVLVPKQCYAECGPTGGKPSSNCLYHPNVYGCVGGCICY